jgi:GT2 family glycosyltransferase
MCLGTQVSPVSYAIGIVNYRTYTDLGRCLETVKIQSQAPVATFVLDVNPDPRKHEDMRAQNPHVHWTEVPNRGFAAGANQIISQVAETCPDAEFVLILNPDIELESCYAENLLVEMSRQADTAMASGKLLRPDRQLVDSAGIVLPRNRRPRDRGSEELDLGQYDRTESVFGATGAAIMLRMSAVEDLSIEGEFFDEDFFLYHEDTDACWRAHLLGWRVLYVASARAVHTRRWRQNERFSTAPQVRRHSFKNHYLQMIKNEKGRDFLINLPVLMIWEVARFGFAFLRDPAILSAYPDALRLSGRAWRKRRALQRRARTRTPVGPLDRPFTRRARQAHPGCAPSPMHKHGSSLPAID